MKLISMTDFVLKQELKLDESYKLASNAIESIFRYANFLKKPLTLGMFVPCDEDGNVLEEPNHLDYKYEKYKGELHFKSDFHKNQYSDKYDQYQQAKERVLFEYKPQFDLSVINHHISQGRTIEYLANFGELTLTQLAIKKLGL